MQKAVLQVSMLVILTYSGSVFSQGGGGRPNDGGGPGGGPGGGSSLLPCRLNRLTELTAADILGVTKVLNGNAAVSTIVGLLSKIKDYGCSEFIGRTCKETRDSANPIGTLSADDITRTICGGDKAPDPGAVFMALHCANTTEICDGLRSVGDTEQCELGNSGRIVAEVVKMAKCEASNITCKVANELESPELQNRLDSSEKIKEFMQCAHRRMGDLKCDKAKAIAKSIQDRIPASDATDQDVTDVAAAFPFFDRQYCEELFNKASDKSVFGSVLKDVKFRCDGAPDKPDPNPGNKPSNGGAGGADQKGLKKPPPPKRPPGLPCDAGCGRFLGERLIALGVSGPIDENEGLQGCLSPKTLAEKLAKPGMCGSIIPRGNYRIAAKLAEKCGPANKNCSLWGEDDFEGIGESIQALGEKFIKTCGEKLCSDGAMELFRRVADKLPGAVRQHLAKLCHGGSGPPTKEVFKKLGSMARGLGPKKLKSANSDDIIQSIEEGVCICGNSGDEGDDLCRKIVSDKAKEYLGALAGDLCQTMKGMSNKKLREAAQLLKIPERADDVIKKFGLDKEDGKGLSRSARMFGADKVAKARDFKPEQLDAEGFKRLKSLGTALPFGAIERMKNSSDARMLGFELLKAQFEDHRQFGAAHNVLSAGVEEDDKDGWQRLRPEDLDELNENAAVMFRPENFRNMTKETKEKICEKIKQAELDACLLDGPKRQAMARLCIDTVKKGSDFTEDEVRALGSLLSDADPSDLDKIDNSLFRRIAGPLFKHRCMSKSMGAKIKEKLQAEIGDDITEEDAASLGHFLIALPDSAKDKVAIAENADAILGQDRAMSERNKRNMMCCHRAMPKSDLDEGKRKMELVKTMVANALRGTQEDLNSKRRRRRRQAVALDCTTVRALGESLSTVTPEDVAAMDVDAVKSCADAFGAEPSLNPLTRQKVYEIVGIESEVCTVDADKLRTYSGLLQALPASKMSCLKFDDIDKMAAFGGLHGWNETQLAALAKTAKSGVSLDKWDSDHVAAAKHIVCGLSADDIGNIPPEAYGDASSQLANLPKCKKDHLKALAKLAKHANAYGPPGEWDQGAIHSMGVVVAGLENNYLAEMNAEQAMGLTPEALQMLSTDQLKEMRLSTLGSLSREQALVISKDTLEGLPDAHQKAIKSSAEGGYSAVPQDQDTSAGSAALISSLTILIPCFALPHV